MKVCLAFIILLFGFGFGVYYFIHFEQANFSLLVSSISVHASLSDHQIWKGIVKSVFHTSTPSNPCYIALEVVPAGRPFYDTVTLKFSAVETRTMCKLAETTVGKKAQVRMLIKRIPDNNPVVVGLEYDGNKENISSYNFEQPNKVHLDGNGLTTYNQYKRMNN